MLISTGKSPSSNGSATERMVMVWAIFQLPLELLPVNPAALLVVVSKTKVLDVVGFPLLSKITASVVSELTMGPIVTFAPGRIANLISNVMVDVPSSSKFNAEEMFCKMTCGAPLSILVALTEDGVRPEYFGSADVAEAKVILTAIFPSKVPSMTDVKVTVWGVFQFAVVNVRFAGETVISEVFDDTMDGIETFAVG